MAGDDGTFTSRIFAGISTGRSCVQYPHSSGRRTLRRSSSGGTAAAGRLSFRVVTWRSVGPSAPSKLGGRWKYVEWPSQRGVINSSIMILSTQGEAPGLPDGKLRGMVTGTGPAPGWLRLLRASRLPRRRRPPGRSIQMEASPWPTIIEREKVLSGAAKGQFGYESFEYLPLSRDPPCGNLARCRCYRGGSRHAVAAMVIRNACPPRWPRWPRISGAELGLV